VTADPVGALRLLRAFVWLRWRVMANSLSARRRSTWQRVGAVAEVIGRALVGLLVLGLSLGGVAFGLLLPTLLVRMSAEVTESGFTEADALLLGVRIVLAFFLLMILLVPAIQGLSGSGLPRPRLLLLPIPLRTLHALETAAPTSILWASKVTLTVNAAISTQWPTREAAVRGPRSASTRQSGTPSAGINSASTVKPGNAISSWAPRGLLMWCRPLRVRLVS
jgi:hypothetical protein